MGIGESVHTMKSDALKRLPDQFFAELVRKTMEVKKNHDDVINLGQGNPDQPTPAHIIEKMKDASSNPLYHKYAPFSGFPFLKQAVADYYLRECNVTIDPETEVAIMSGTKTGLVEVSQCLLNPGDTALVPDPGYPDYWSGIALAGAEMVGMPLLPENDFLPNFQKISKDILTNAKLMFLNYPNNPTGAVASEEFFQQVVGLGQEHSIHIVHDYAYGAIGFDGERPISFLETPGAKDIGIEMMTLSKTYNMAGWRVGFAVGNKEIIAAINLIQDHYYCSLFGGIQEAAAYALTADQTCVSELVKMYESRRNVLVEEASRIGWNGQAPAGSFFAWFPVPDGYSSEAFADLLLYEARVVVAPGNGFGEHGEGFVRLGLLCEEEELREAIKRIEKLNVF